MSTLLKTLVAVATGTVLATSALAETSSVDRDQSCRAEARRQVLQGEALVDFMKHCNDGAISLKYVLLKTPADPAALLSGEAKANANRAAAE
ncbi:MAG TPA: hypothetical protein VJR58_01365 [Vineibacter sp.]|nr:hypothetical protein [Vineibacter sp.]